MTKPLALALLLGVAPMMAACQTLAPYGPAASPTAQGWSQTQIESDRWRVNYRGQAAPDVVRSLALRRAAELTLEQGYEWFVLDDQYVAPGQASGPRPSVSIGGGSAQYGGYRSSGVGVGVGFTFGGGQPSDVSLDIRMGQGPAPREAYDAAQVRSNLI